jgi:hypothetical protein
MQRWTDPLDTSGPQPDTDRHPDGPSLRGLMRRLDEERITSELWAAHCRRATDDAIAARELVAGLRQQLRAVPSLRWRERLGWFAVGVMVAPNSPVSPPVSSTPVQSARATSTPASTTTAAHRRSRRHTTSPHG